MAKSMTRYVEDEDKVFCLLLNAKEGIYLKKLLNSTVLFVDEGFEDTSIRHILQAQLGEMRMACK